MANKTFNNVKLNVEHLNLSADTSRSVLVSGENISHSLGKIARWYNDISWSDHTHTNFNSSVNRGAENQPIYILNGNPTAIAYTIKSSVPENALFTDDKVKQSGVDTSKDENYEILFAGSVGNNTTTEGVLKNTGFTYNPKTGTLSATNLSGSVNSSNLTGTIDASRLPDSMVVANSYGPASGETLSHEGTFDVPYVTVDKYGRITSASNKTFKLPAQYTHPSHNAASSGLYKITVDALGHVTATNTIVKSDIPALDYIPNTHATTTYGTCSTAASTAAKVVTLATNGVWTLKVGAIIAVKFTATNTAVNPTLNVNNTGAKPIYYNTAVITDSNLSYAGYANSVHTYVYDGTNYVYLGHSADNNSTYSDMQAATELTAGTHGLVPAPAAGAQTYFLRGDAKWINVTPSLIGAAASDHSHSYLPLAGGTMTGEIISTNANGLRISNNGYGAILRNDSEHFYILFTDKKTDGSDATAGDNWNTLRPFMIDLSNGSVIMNHGLQVSGGINGTLNGTATSANYPVGFSSRQTTATWGNQDGTVLTDWATPNGGDIAFRENSGQVNVVIDGFYYQNEGRYKVLDTNNWSDSITLSTLGAASASHNHRFANGTDGGDTVWSVFGLRDYNNGFPDGVTNKIYGWGQVISFGGNNGRFDMYVNHNSSNNADASQKSNGIQFRSGWADNKREWRMILDSTNYGSYITPTGIGAAASSHDHSASNITSGTLANDRLPGRLQEVQPTAVSNMGDTDSGFYYSGTGHSPFTVYGSDHNDMMVIAAKYNSLWQGQIGLDYRSNHIAYRNKNNNTWGSWGILSITNEGGYTNGTVTYNNANAFIAYQGGYSTIFRNDGNNFYILLSDKGTSATGNWNSLRPFMLDLTNGNITMSHNVGVSGILTVANNIILNETRNIILRPNNAGYTAGIGYDTSGNECISLWAKNSVTRLRWNAGIDMSNLTSGMMMGIVPDFEISKASGTAYGYIGGAKIFTETSCRGYAIHDGDDISTNPWHLVASVSVANQEYADRTLVLFVNSEYLTRCGGVMIAHVRGSNGAVESISFKWLYKSGNDGYGFIDNANFQLRYTNNTSTKTFTAEIWCKMVQRWECFHFYMLDGGRREHTLVNDWVLHNDASGSASFTVGSGGCEISHPTINANLDGNATSATSATSASYANYPTGFSARQTAATWGNQTGSFLTGWTTPSSAEIQFRDNSGQLNVIIDGVYYQNEGNYRVLDAAGYDGIVGSLEFANSGTAVRGVGGMMGDNDYWRVVGGATASNAGYLEIATGDDATEPIYVRQYNNGKFGTCIRSATLLDESGNTSFPGTVTAPRFNGIADKVYTTSHIGSWYLDMDWDGTYFQTRAKYESDTLPINVARANDAGYASSAGNANYSTNAGNARLLEAFVNDNFTDGGHFVTARRDSNGWSTRLWMAYSDGKPMSNAISVSYADNSGNADTVDGYHASSFASSGHTHGLAHSDFTQYINTTSDKFADCGIPNGDDFVLKSLRTQANSPSWMMGNYSAGIAFGGADTKGVITHRYDYAEVKFAGGAGESPNWYFSITGASGGVYSLSSIASNSHSHWAGATDVDGTDTAWSDFKVKEYDSAYPDDMSRKVYGWGGVISFGQGNFRLDIYANHNSTTWDQTSNGLQFRSGWAYDKKSWRMILDERNFYNIMGNHMRLGWDGSYHGMMTPDGGQSDWIRTTSAGIIPIQSGGAGNGHCQLGTTTWYFSSAYIDTVYGNLSGNASSATSATSSYYLYTKYKDGSAWYTDNYRFYTQWTTGPDNSDMLRLKTEGNYKVGVDFAINSQNAENFHGMSYTSFMGTVYDGDFYQLAGPGGMVGVWIKTTTPGLLPNKPGNMHRTSGSSLGDDEWYYHRGFIANLYTRKIEIGSNDSNRVTILPVDDLGEAFTHRLPKGNGMYALLGNGSGWYGCPAAGSWDGHYYVSTILENNPSGMYSFVNAANGIWYNVISARHRNGSSDGNAYGFYISTVNMTSSNVSLTWNNQNSSAWGSERTIIDTGNWTSNIHHCECIWSGSQGIGGGGTVTVSSAFSNYHSIMITFWYSGDGGDVNAGHATMRVAAVNDTWVSGVFATDPGGGPYNFGRSASFAVHCNSSNRIVTFNLKSSITLYNIYGIKIW